MTRQSSRPDTGAAAESASLIACNIPGVTEGHSDLTRKHASGLLQPKVNKRGWDVPSNQARR